MKIIGFSGKKQSGKTTAVDFLALKLQDSLGNFVEIRAFADCLKELVFRYLAAPTEEYKDTAYDPFTTEESKRRVHPCGKAYRELFQLIGTGWFRMIWPEIWVENYKFRIQIDPPKVLLTPDVRFPNEVKCIQEMGGHVIRLLRAPFPEDKHESETALDGTESATIACQAVAKVGGTLYGAVGLFDAIIDNRNMSIEQQNEAVWKLVNERGWV